jgi:hypothetical protein
VARRRRPGASTIAPTAPVTSCFRGAVPRTLGPASSAQSRSCSGFARLERSRRRTRLDARSIWPHSFAKCKFEPLDVHFEPLKCNFRRAKRKFGPAADGRIVLQMPAQRVIERRPELYAERLAGTKLAALAPKFGGTPSSLSRHFRSAAGRAGLEAAPAAAAEQAQPRRPGSSGPSARELQHQRALVRAEQMLAEALQDPGLADRCGSGEHERACARVQRAHRALAEAKRAARTPASAPARQRGTCIQSFQVGGLSW